MPPGFMMLAPSLAKSCPTKLLKGDFDAENFTLGRFCFRIVDYDADPARRGSGALERRRDRRVESTSADKHHRTTSRPAAQLRDAARRDGGCCESGSRSVQAVSRACETAGRRLGGSRRGPAGF